MKNLVFIVLVVLCYSCSSHLNGKKNEVKEVNESLKSNSIIQENDYPNILSFKVNLKKNSLDLFWKDDSNQIIGNAKRLKTYLKSKNKTLIFAMNAGMYAKSQKPLGLYVQKGQIKNELNTVQEAFGNFYMQPNGVFALTHSDSAFICKSTKYKFDQIKYATQSGPMLLINGKVHSKFTKGSKHKHIRNGVGILPNGDVLFAMSTVKINFYDFAKYFKSQGCENALYLDGFVSRTYLPAQNWIQLDGDFGVMIGVTKRLE